MNKINDRYGKNEDSIKAGNCEEMLFNKQPSFEDEKFLVTDKAFADSLQRIFLTKRFLSSLQI